MNARLIPWCLAALGFGAVLTPLLWQRDPVLAGAEVPSRAAAVTAHLPGALPVSVGTQPAAALASGAEDETPKPPLILPLPAPTQPDVDPDVRPVPDDQPTVEDLPVQRVAQETEQDP